MSIYRSPAGKKRMLQLYDENWAALHLDVEHCYVPTRHGKTHVVMCGPREAPPVIVFHGGNMISPVSFAWITSLTSRYRFYAPDTVGHPGYSDETRLKPGTFQYGEWASDILDGLKLEKPAVMGGSYGAGIVLNLAACAPQKIERAVLVVPSGFAPPPIVPLIRRIVLPMLMYRLTGQHTWLIRSLTPMYTEPAENVIEVTGEVFKHVNIEPEMPRTVQKQDLQNFTSPTLVLAAEKDILFPPKNVLPRAKAVIPNLVAAEIIPGSTHFLLPHLWGQLCRRIDQFLQLSN